MGAANVGSGVKKAEDLSLSTECHGLCNVRRPATRTVIKLAITTNIPKQHFKVRATRNTHCFGEAFSPRFFPPATKSKFRFFLSIHLQDEDQKKRHKKENNGYNLDDHEKSNVLLFSRLIPAVSPARKTGAWESFSAMGWRATEMKLGSPFTYRLLAKHPPPHSLLLQEAKRAVTRSQRVIINLAVRVKMRMRGNIQKLINR